MDALMLPSNWQKVKLGDIFFITAGGDLSKPHYSNTKQSDFNYPIYSNAIEKKGLYGYSSFFIIKNKSITITSRGTIGVAFFRDYPYVPIGRLLVLQPKISNIDCRFYAEYINSKVKFNTEQTTIPQLTIPKVALCEIPLPPLNEQAAIANILSDVDRYLYSLDALILKKESVKKALSFELLSQRKRLKGFNQAWQRVRLGDICEFGNGGAYETLIVENGDFKLISLNSIDIDGNLKNTMKRVNFYDNSLKQDDIVMVLSDVAHGDFLGLCAVIPSNDYVLNQRMGRLRKRNDCVNILFLRLYINANQKYFKMQGQGSSQLNLSKKAIEDFEILLPPLNEQIVIANILSDLDNEIISLKNKKRQFDNIKKALNHDLMSAKIRVLKK
ncbi:restriction endonuclease subunit S [Helicobacter pylori]|uniref:restriction endonuclease subunit S n=1 Tax=Helicobacter pylori TaxID=210 RepID=UPI0009924357|nr:restriction endonuclease subunit S [Helicobacter pylori]OOQ36660.1 restriction endonuclease subunit S [Helicobacter pylori]PDW95211.1 restriction endonuclease subunit S [Helicobacter pylori]